MLRKESGKKFACCIKAKHKKYEEEEKQEMDVGSGRLGESLSVSAYLSC